MDEPRVVDHRNNPLSQVLKEALTMTYTQAKLIIWNHRAYDKAKVREAAVFILGTINARREDMDQATNLL